MLLNKHSTHGLRFYLHPTPPEQTNFTALSEPECSGSRVLLNKHSTHGLRFYLHPTPPEQTNF
ncbi:hypothetical protein, partial [Escherichia coli]|uniref:hypothetical protein n=1 Tax=Escherichia coli TaxID=562 RepID=UPI00197A929F